MKIDCGTVLSLMVQYEEDIGEWWITEIIGAEKRKESKAREAKEDIKFLKRLGNYMNSCYPHRSRIPSPKNSIH